MEQWELKQEQSSSDDRKEIAAAKKRLSELDELIQGLYESQIKGTLPERQAQRLISQYDGEQLQLESRISELEKPDTEIAPKKADINRFIALVRKYQVVTEVTDTMLYEFIDRVEVHAATGGSTRYRQQIIDIHFNFIGQFVPPGSVMSEEERIAIIDAEQEEKLVAKRKRSSENRAKKLASLKERAKTDPEAAEELRIRREQQAEKNRLNKQRREERMARDPEYAALTLARQAESTRKHTAKRKEAFDELKERAKTDPQAAAEVDEIRARQRAASNKSRAKKQELLDADPELAAAERAKANERAKRHYAQQKAKWEEIRERAESDPEAAAEYAEHMRKQSEATMKSRRKLIAEAETDPQAAAKLQAKRDRINNWTKEHKAELVAQAETDPEAAAKLADIRARQVQATQRWQAKQKELAKAAEIEKEELNETA